MSRLGMLADGGHPQASAAVGPGRWSAAGALPVPVFWFGHQEGPQLLPDGRVLAAGGARAGIISVADAAVFDPAGGSWAGTGSLGAARRLHTLTVLADGRVLAAGGIPYPDRRYPPSGMDSAELFDPRTGAWASTGAMSVPRYGHSATLLPDGRVLVAGGAHVRDRTTELTRASAEFYDPESGTWAPARPMGDERWGHHAVPLSDGRILVVGGFAATGFAVAGTLALCETYDPASDTWAPVGSLRTPRRTHQAVRLADGAVLAIGGGNPRLCDGAASSPYSLATVERFDPASGQWSADTPLPWGRSYHRALVLGTGEVLVIGGTDDACADAGYQNSVRYASLTRTWTATGGMVSGRWAFGAVLLGDGRVLAAGGAVRSGVATRVLGQDVMAEATEVFAP